MGPIRKDETMIEKIQMTAFLVAAIAYLPIHVFQAEKIKTNAAKIFLLVAFFGGLVVGVSIAFWRIWN